jgi:hypothetical protein
MSKLGFPTVTLIGRDRGTRRLPVDLRPSESAHSAIADVADKSENDSQKNNRLHQAGNQ